MILELAEDEYIIDKQIMVNITLWLDNGEEINESFYCLEEAEEFLDSVASHEV